MLVVLSILNSIRLCQRCTGFADCGKIDFGVKPYITFQVDQLWKPRRVKVLFIAESPPWSKERYFYKTDMSFKRTNLQREVLSRLNLSSLEEFKAKGYFLIDAVKCRLNKQGNEGVPAEVLRNCTGQFLQVEIDSLDPEVIFVLGNSAKSALQLLPTFNELRCHSVTEGYDCVVCGRRVILCVYPGGKTRMHLERINRAFSKLSVS